MWVLDIVLSGLKAVFTGLLSGWFTKDPKDVELDEIRKADEIEENANRVGDDVLAERLRKFKRK